MTVDTLLGVDEARIKEAIEGYEKENLSIIGGFGIAQSDIELLIPTNPTYGINFEYSGFAIKLTPQGLTSATSAIQSNNSIVYDEAYGVNTKLIYTPMLSGVKEDIVLAEYTDDATYTFVLETDGLNLYTKSLSTLQLSAVA